MSKACSSCFEIKPESEFSGDAQKKDGLKTQCKTCLKNKQKTYRQKVIAANNTPPVDPNSTLGKIDIANTALQNAMGNNNAFASKAAADEVSKLIAIWVIEQKATPTNSIRIPNVQTNDVAMLKGQLLVAYMNATHIILTNDDVEIVTYNNATPCLAVFNGANLAPEQVNQMQQQFSI
jgi:hypothetical protein